jgi:hypothetical protein
MRITLLTLQATRNQDDLVSLDYIREDNGDEIVQVKWKSGSGKRIMSRWTRARP